jgi:hypothetical protein
VAFAVPTILGELKRHLRDHCWSMHVPRSTKELAPEVARARDALAASLRRSRASANSQRPSHSVPPRCAMVFWPARASASCQSTRRSAAVRHTLNRSPRRMARSTMATTLSMRSRHGAPPSSSCLRTTGAFCHSASSTSSPRQKPQRKSAPRR